MNFFEIACTVHDGHLESRFLQDAYHAHVCLHPLEYGGRNRNKPEYAHMANTKMNGDREKKGEMLICRHVALLYFEMAVQIDAFTK